jgi:hypothetical protein
VYVRDEIQSILMSTILRQRQLPNRLDVRLTDEQRARLEEAARRTPGCSTPSGVVRHALDRFLNEILTDSSA